MGLIRWIFDIPKPPPKPEGPLPQTGRERFEARMRKRFGEAAAATMARARAAGSKSYIWRTVGDEAVCPACRQNEGKHFVWAKPPKTGHPGVHHCSSGWCRCTAEPLDLED